MENFFSRLKKFVLSTAKDSRIPAHDKRILKILLIYILSPIDIVPEWIPLYGIIDDFILIALFFDYFFSVLDDHILLSHYPWTMKSYVRIRSLARFFTLFVPRIIRRKLWSFVKSPY